VSVQRPTRPRPRPNGRTGGRQPEALAIRDPQVRALLQRLDTLIITIGAGMERTAMALEQLAAQQARIVVLKPSKAQRVDAAELEDEVPRAAWLDVGLPPRKGEG
jgi:hypothetical protein